MEKGHNQSVKQIGFEDDIEDGIGRLPDCLLAEILSCLPETKYAIRTSVLSKRWRHIWTRVRNLIFSIWQLPCPDSFSIVDKTLTQRPQFKLNKFILGTLYVRRLESHINNWIRYAVNCNVEELSLNLLNVGYKTKLPIDELFFSCSCFTDLELPDCVLNPRGAISWKNLRSLRITSAKLDEGLIENILSGSPVLETLELNYCSGYTQLNITSKSVKNLVLDGYIGHYHIEINAPNILSLTIKGRLWVTKLLLLNVSSLVEADLNHWDIGKTAEYEEETLKGFIHKLRHVKVLKLGTYCRQALSRLEAMGFVYPSNLKLTDATR